MNFLGFWVLGLVFFLLGGGFGFFLLSPLCHEFCSFQRDNGFEAQSTFVLKENLGKTKAHSFPAKEQMQQIP